jgi:hypothetical protein
LPAKIIVCPSYEISGDFAEKKEDVRIFGDKPGSIAKISDLSCSVAEEIDFSTRPTVLVNIIVPSVDFLLQEKRKVQAKPKAIRKVKTMVDLELFIRVFFRVLLL